MIRHFWRDLIAFFSEEEPADEPTYDPAHVAGMIVIVVAAIGVLFWLLWTLLVFQGGIFPKIAPFFEVAFSAKTVQDFGWVGYPYELGVFEGFIANSVALVLLVALILGIWRLFQSTADLAPKDLHHED